MGMRNEWKENKSVPCTFANLNKLTHGKSKSVSGKHHRAWAADTGAT